MAHEHDGHDHDHHQHRHHHGHENDRGIRGALRYLRWLPRMWRSEVNDTVVAMVAPVPGERVVDIGAGMGAGTMRAAASGADVVAVEPTPFMRGVLTLRRTLGRHRGNVTVVDGAAEDLTIEDASADAVWAVNTMHHWTDHDRAVGEIARALRPGGRVVLVDEDFTDPTHPEHDRFEGADDEGHHHGFAMVGADEMGERLASAGFVDVDAAKRSVAGRPATVVTARTSGRTPA